MNPDTRKFLSTQMVWIDISLATSLALSFLLPFTISLVAIIAVLGMSYFMRKWQMRRMRMTSSGGFGSMFAGGSDISHVCMACGQKFRGGVCPRYGSKMRKADF